MESALLVLLSVWIYGPVAAFIFFLRIFRDFPPNGLLMALAVFASVLWPCLLVVMFFWFVKDKLRKEEKGNTYRLRMLARRIVGG